VPVGGACAAQFTTCASRILVSRLKASVRNPNRFHSLIMQMPVISSGKKLRGQWPLYHRKQRCLLCVALHANAMLRICLQLDKRLGPTALAIQQILQPDIVCTESSFDEFYGSAIGDRFEVDRALQVIGS
jgi:hypothetical protein